MQDLEERRGPWTRHNTRVVVQRPYFTAHVDAITNPGGQPGVYDWIEAADQVRVAALDDAGNVYIAIQHHYLPDAPLWQLPGGGVEPGESRQEAASRELAEEVGAYAQHWQSLGAVWLMPSLTTARAHLWVARILTFGPAALEAGEADLTVQAVPLERARAAAMDGTIGCAASVHLVLAAAEMGF